MAKPPHARLVVCSVFMILGLCLSVMAQDPDEDEQTRMVFAAEFVKARPNKSRPKTPVKTPTAKTPNSQVQAFDLLGLTLWQLRPPKAGENTEARILDHESDSDTVLVAERVSSDTKFKEGQKVRLSIESPVNGYLYVIDREQYADGTFSDPYLIFPTQKIRDGDNSVTAGRLIEIPDQDDNPVYFKMKRNRADQVSEVLTVIVSPKPLTDLQPGRRALKLPTEQFAKWEQSWKLPVRRVELANHVGSAYTKAEMSAAASKVSLLSPDDPPPQTIYRVATKPGNPIMIALVLRYELAKP